LHEAVAMGIVLVTGASSGVGRATALALAAEGVTVVAVARSIERVQALVQQIERTGGTALGLQLDILDERAVAGAVERIGATYGHLDGLVNCAGVAGKGYACDRDASSWRASIGTNLLGPMFVTRAALPLLRRSSAAHVVNISSTAALHLNAGNAPYVAAKAGLNAFTESLRKEVAPFGIRVTLISPGLIESEFFERGAQPSPFRDDIKPLQPADLANIITFAMRQPVHVSINELVVRPTDLPGGSHALQSSSGA
jgi:clavulanate-9-aldehyde reductase